MSALEEQVCLAAGSGFEAAGEADGDVVQSIRISTIRSGETGEGLAEAGSGGELAQGTEVNDQVILGGGTGIVEPNEQILGLSGGDTGQPEGGQDSNFLELFHIINFLTVWMMFGVLVLDQ